MLTIKVKQHVLRRWPQRVGQEVDEEQIERMFRAGYTTIEPAKKGRLIVHTNGYVFVITRTNTSIIVHTTYGKYGEYKKKRSNLEQAYTQFEIDKWERHQYRRTVRSGKGS
jgi:hypothetical protein